MFGERMQQLRQLNNETQEQLAKFLGVSRQTVANYEIEKHEPDFDTLNKIAIHYNVSTDYLLGRTNIRDSEKYINEFKEYPKPVTNLIEAICLLTKEHDDYKKYNYIKTIINELNKII